MDTRLALSVTAALEVVGVIGGILLVFFCRKHNWCPKVCAFLCGECPGHCCKCSDCVEIKRPADPRGGEGRRSQGRPSAEDGATVSSANTTRSSRPPTRRGERAVGRRPRSHSAEPFASRSSFSSRHSGLSLSPVDMSPPLPVVGPTLWQREPSSRVWRNLGRPWGLPPALRRVWAVSDAQLPRTFAAVQPNPRGGLQERRVLAGIPLWRSSEVLGSPPDITWVGGLPARSSRNQYNPTHWMRAAQQSRSLEHVVSFPEVAAPVPLCPPPYDMVVGGLTGSVGGRGLARSDPQLNIQRSYTPPPPYEVADPDV